MNPFSADELERIKEITELYSYTKNLILYSEELNNLSTFMPPINEIKDAFDHFMRITSVKFGMNTGDEAYIRTNLDKVFSHLYRATFELFDYIRIYQKDSIDKKLAGISNDALIHVFPEYYQKIKPAMEDLITKIPGYKKDKDIGDPDIAVVKQYYASIEEMREYIRKIDAMLPALIDYDTKRKAELAETDQKVRREKYKDWCVQFLIALAIIVIGVIIGYLLPK
jgi:hypothetical protein